MERKHRGPAWVLLWAPAGSWVCKVLLALIRTNGVGVGRSDAPPWRISP